MSSGVTPTEKLLTAYCERSFLKLWAYANPYKDDGHEMCDLIAVFGNTVFLFFDRAKPWTAGEEVTPELAWERWKRDAIDRQVKTAYGAERYIRNGRKVFLDGARTKPLPLEITPDCRVYKIIVANGVAEACKNASLENIGGSLAVAYAPADSPGINAPFFIKLDKERPVHVLDSHSMPIVLGELDTVDDFATYLQLKEEEIAQKRVISYCGEEDYLARYLAGDSEEAQATITVKSEENAHAVVLPEGAWSEFSRSDLYKRTKQADQVSYGWDQLINGACEHFVEGKTHGNANLFNQLNPVYDMVREPRHKRRLLSQRLARAIALFPEPGNGFQRWVTMVRAETPETAYVLLVLGPEPLFQRLPDWRQKRRHLLEVACGVASIKNPDLAKIVGIGVEHPNYAQADSGNDFALLVCNSLTEESRAYYRRVNEPFQFFETQNLRQEDFTVSKFA